jgi:ABC-type uncharacterized transport system ATPase subunit
MVHALVSKNSAGKPKLIKIITGICRIDERGIYVESRKVDINSVKDYELEHFKSFKRR